MVFQSFVDDRKSNVLRGKPLCRDDLLELIEKSLATVKAEGRRADALQEKIGEYAIPDASVDSMTGAIVDIATFAGLLYAEVISSGAQTRLDIEEEA